MRDFPNKYIKNIRDRKIKQITKDRPIQEKSHIISHVNRKKMFMQIKQIDRNQTCPFLVRIFYAINDENRYQNLKQLPVQRQVRLHLWMNSTLKQITQTLRGMIPILRTKQKFFFWRVVYSKEKKTYEKQQLGWVYTSKRYDKVEQKALCHTKFNIGDMMDISVTYK